MIRAFESEPHIVVVDAQPSDYQELTSLAGQHQWQLHFLTTARATITWIRRARADLWLLNVRLPDMSGFALYEVLRDVLPGSRALIIDDIYDAEQERRACQSGAVLYLCKGPERLLACRPIVELLRAHESIYAGREVAPSAEIERQQAGQFASGAKSSQSGNEHCQIL